MLSAISVLHLTSVSFVLELSSLDCVVSCAFCISGSLHGFRSLALLDELDFSDISAFVVVAELSDIEEKFCLEICVSVTTLLVSAADDAILTMLEVDPEVKLPLFDKLNALSSRCGDIGMDTLLDRSSATLSTVDVIGDCDSAFPKLNDMDEMELGDEALGDFGDDE